MRTESNKGPKCTGGKHGTKSKYWKMQDRKTQNLKMQDLKLKDHFRRLENAGPEKGGPKRERVETEGPQNTSVPDARKLQIIQLC